MRYKLGNVNRDILALRFYMEVSKDPNQIVENYDKSLDISLLKLRLFFQNHIFVIIFLGLRQ